MKVDRRLREYRDIVLDLCSKFALKPPIIIRLMKNYHNRREISWGKTTHMHSTDSYKIQIRKYRMENDKPIKRERKDIIKSICHELAHSIYHEHCPEHFALTNEMFLYSKNKGEI